MCQVTLGNTPHSTTNSLGHFSDTQIYLTMSMITTTENTRWSKPGTSQIFPDSSCLLCVGAKSTLTLTSSAYIYKSFTLDTTSEYTHILTCYNYACLQKIAQIWMHLHRNLAISLESQVQLFHLPGQVDAELLRGPSRGLDCNLGSVPTRSGDSEIAETRTLPDISEGYLIYNSLGKQK